jgi:transposase
LFLFVNRYRNRIKILYWDRDGFCIWYKRLERGVFELPTRGPAGVELDHKQLSRLLGGLDLRSGRRRRRRYRRVLANSCHDALP